MVAFIRMLKHEPAKHIETFASFSSPALVIFMSGSSTPCSFLISVKFSCKNCSKSRVGEINQHTLQISFAVFSIRIRFNKAQREAG
jgi:hypothetical protein